MEKKSFMKRTGIMTGIVLVIMLASAIAYNCSWRIGNNAAQQALANISAVLLFASIGFGTLVIYPVSFFRGATVTERILACLVTPIAWNIKEIVRVGEFFTFGESLYYGLNQVFLLSLFGAFAQMGLCELICRWRLIRRGATAVRIATPAPIVSILVGAAAFYIILLWEVGVHFFYGYITIYKAIFF
ncbi:MAG: hypothetical protein HY801_12270 [Candidatus Lindowbacteria bacterium]|nr:hypothetical protein [Candidatus Lindowbacteria bacterium]